MKRNCFILAIVLILTALMGAASHSLAQNVPKGGKWQKKADMPTARYHLSAEAISGLIYAMGGRDVFQGRVRWLATVEVYNPATDTWKKGTDMLAPRSHFVTAVVGGKIYAFGGITQVERRGKKIEKTLTAIEVYDPAADAWQKIGDSPQARKRLATAELNGKVYLIAGLTNVGGGGTTLEVYDVASNQWKKLADLNEGRDRNSTASAVNGKIYAIGGFNKDLSWLKSIEAYDPATDTWQNKKDMPTVRDELPTTTPAVGGKFYVIGGEGDGGRVLPTVEEYDPAKNEWTKMASMPTARRGLSVTAVKGKLYAIGGGGEGGFLFGNVANPAPAFASVEEYTPPGWPFAVEPQGKLATTWATIRTAD